MAYTPQAWEDSPSTATPITAERLNHMEAGIAAAVTSTAVTAIEPATTGTIDALMAANPTVLYYVPEGA